MADPITITITNVVTHHVTNTLWQINNVWQTNTVSLSSAPIQTVTNAVDSAAVLKDLGGLYTNAFSQLQTTVGGLVVFVTLVLGFFFTWLQNRMLKQNEDALKRHAEAVVEAQAKNLIGRIEETKNETTKALKSEIIQSTEASLNQSRKELAISSQKAQARLHRNIASGMRLGPTAATIATHAGVAFINMVQTGDQVETNDYLGFFCKCLSDAAIENKTEALRVFDQIEDELRRLGKLEDSQREILRDVKSKIEAHR